MRTILIAVMATISLMQQARAAEMTGADIKTLISGKTVYIELTATSSGGQGQGVIYYAPDGNALYRTAKGALWHGTWTIKDNTACTDWKEFPNNPCTKYDKQGDTVVWINVATGQARGKIVRIADGNAEKLAP